MKQFIQVFGRFPESRKLQLLYEAPVELPGQGIGNGVGAIRLAIDEAKASAAYGVESDPFKSFEAPSVRGVRFSTKSAFNG